MTTRTEPLTERGAKSHLTENAPSEGTRELELFFKTVLHPVTSIFMLTFIIAIAVAAFSDAPLADIMAACGSGLISNFGYAMQFMLLMLLSYTLAVTPLFDGWLGKMSQAFENERTAVIFVALFSSILGWLNWALGAVCGAILAQKIARFTIERQRKVNYPLLVAAGLAGLVVSESGISGNVLLFVTQKVKTFSAAPVLPLGTSALLAFNIAVNLVVAVCVAAVLSMFAGKKSDEPAPVESSTPEKLQQSKEPNTFAVKMENSRVVSVGFGCIGLAYILLHFIDSGAMNFSTYLLLLIVLGIVLRKAPMSFQADVISASSYAWIFFFPLIFAGSIQGMLNMEAIRESVTRALMALGTENSFPEVNMICAAIVNFIIPNAGAQWLIEGKSILSAGQQFNLPPQSAILSFCYGTGVAKTLNLFVLLPILALVKVKFTSVFKYLFSVAAVAGIVYLAAVIIFL